MQEDYGKFREKITEHFAETTGNFAIVCLTYKANGIADQGLGMRGDQCGAWTSAAPFLARLSLTNNQTTAAIVSKTARENQTSPAGGRPPGHLC